MGGSNAPWRPRLGKLLETSLGDDSSTVVGRVSGFVPALVVGRINVANDIEDLSDCAGKLLGTLSAIGSDASDDFLGWLSKRDRL